MGELFTKLTDNEIRDVTKYLEEGKSLPEKYRFLLFEDKREVELVWNGKTNETTQVVLPFQIIEQVDEPRKEGIVKEIQTTIFDIDNRGRQLAGWTNKLIWGENKLILSSLKNGPLRESIEAEGGLKLIYIDPPFDVGANFNMKIDIGDDSFTKEANVLEELAYRDTWGKGADSFISMIYERLSLMKDLLADDGVIYVHCDWRVNSYIKLILDEIFGKSNARNAIIWKRTSAHNDPNRYGIIDDTIHFYSKSNEWTWNDPKTEYEDWYIDRYYRYSDPDGRKFLSRDISAPSHGSSSGIYEWNGKLPARGRMWAYTKAKMEKLDSDNRLFYTKNGIPRLKQYLDEMEGNPVQSIWDDILPIVSWSTEGVNYPTQKPGKLLKRIIEASTNEGDIVADFFCGSGTTLAIAEDLNRKWIGADLGKFAIHTARKRMIETQRVLKNNGQNYRAFEILNLGKYERQHYVGVNTNFRTEHQQKQLEQKENEFTEMLLQAYKAEKINGFRTFHGKKAGRLVAIGPINLPVSRLFVEKIIEESIEKLVTKVDILGFEFEMGLFPNIQEEAKNKGINLALKYIPRDVFDKRAIEKEQVIFYDVSYIEIKPHIKENTTIHMCLT